MHAREFARPAGLRVHKSREAAGNYGRSVDLSYTYNVVNQLTAISDAADSNCSVACNADGVFGRHKAA